MHEKLTLRLDDKAIAIGKSYARKNNTSLSQVVQNYLLLLGEDDSLVEVIPISKKLSTLAGIGAGNFTESDYKAHLEQKYS